MDAKICKIGVDVRKTLPIPGIQYGSQSYSARAEMEISVDPGDDTDAMVSLTKQMLDGLKEMLNEKVDRWFEDPKGDQDDRDEASATKQSLAPARVPGTPVTEAQLRYITKLTDDKGEICKRFGINSLDELTVAQASSSIDLLKADRDRNAHQESVGRAPGE